MSVIVAEQIIQRLKSLYGIEMDTEFAGFLGISPSTLSNWKARNTIDFALVLTKCAGVNYHYMLTGEGEPFARNEAGSILAHSLHSLPNFEQHHFGGDSGLFEQRLHQAQELETSLKELFQESFKGTAERFQKSYQKTNTSQGIDMAEVSFQPAPSTILDYLVRKITHELFTSESGNSERSALTDDSYRAILDEITSTTTLSFSLATRSLPAPLKLPFLMRRIAEIIEPLLREVYFRDIYLALEEVLAPIMRTAQKHREHPDLYCRFSLSNQKFQIIIEDYSEYSRVYGPIVSANFSQKHHDNNAVEYRQGLFMARQILDEVFYSNDPGRFTQITLVKYFSGSSEKNN